MILIGKGLPVTVPFANASSGYSRDDRQLGGGFQYDYSPVMTVDTTHRSYWRGETRSFYTGSGWELSDAEKRLPLSGVNTGDLPGDPRFNASLLKTMEVKQTVQMNNETVYPVLFGAFSLQRVENLNDGENRFEPFRWSSRQSEIRFTAKKDYPNKYTIISQVPVIDEDGLRQAKANYASVPEWSEYLQLPRDLPARVKQLAADLTKSAESPYDKVKLIEQYLQLTYPYTSTPDESKGKSKDFVDRFLFEVKEGYCDYYSTAMVVLGRSLGIPTRWVKGYSSGQSATPEELLGLGYQGFTQIDPNAADTYTVRNADAHSWVEVYFDGYGWIPFEPTAGFSLPGIVQGTEIEPSSAPLETTVTPELPEVVKDGFSWLRFLTISAAVIAIMIIFIYLSLKMGWFAAWKEKTKKVHTTNFNQKIIVEFDRFLRYSRRNGYSRGEHETMREATVRWSQKSKWLKSDLETVLGLFERAKYSKAESSEQDYLLMSQAAQKLRTQMK